MEREVNPKENLTIQQPPFCSKNTSCLLQLYLHHHVKFIRTTEFQGLNLAGMPIKKKITEEK